MNPFTEHKGLVVPLDRANVDTDLIIPKQFLKSVKKTGFGPNLFDQLRYMDEGQPGMDNSKRELNPAFILNKPNYKGASIMLARENFGCGSSREHAPWALLDYGFRVIIGPSFADIFYNNCFKNSILPVVLPKDTVDNLFQEVVPSKEYTLQVDLFKKIISKPSGEIIHFEIDEYRKECLIKGLDDIGITLQKAAKITLFEEKHRKITPWLY